ncbi:hypothetical protein CCMA1212_001783, partial [Trichoderma ghanense]
RVSSLPCFSRLSSTRFGASTLNNFNATGSLDLRCAYCWLADEATEAREGSGGLVFPFLFTHACRDTASGPKSAGCHPTRFLRFSSVGWPHEVVAANSLQCYPQRGWMKAAQRCAGALEQARSCLAYQEQAGSPWGYRAEISQSEGWREDNSWPWPGLLRTASVPVMQPAAVATVPSRCGRWHTQNHANVVAEDQSGLAEAPGDLPLEPHDLGHYAVAVLYEARSSQSVGVSLTPRPRTYHIVASSKQNCGPPCVPPLLFAFPPPCPVTWQS